MTDNQIILSVQDLGMQFGGLHALKQISFNILQKQITGLIGPNGAGKTTLFNCLTGFYRPTKGKIFLHSAQKKIPLPTRSYQVARLGIARTFQNIRLFKNMTSIENLIVAQPQFTTAHPFSGLFRTAAFRKLETEAIKNAYHWLDCLGLSDISNHVAGALPYGQQRLLEIGRALCARPKLLCLDEPAAGMNPHETEILAQILARLKAEHHLALLIIEHDMSLMMQICDTIVVLDHGQCIATGSPANIQTDSRVIAAYLGTPVLV